MSGSQSNQFSSSGGSGLSSQRTLLWSADTRHESQTEYADKGSTFKIYTKSCLYLSLYSRVFFSKWFVVFWPLVLLLLRSICTVIVLICHQTQYLGMIHFINAFRPNCRDNTTVTGMALRFNLVRTIC